MLRVDTLGRKRILNLALRFSSLRIQGVYIARGTRIYADLAVDQGTRINGAAVIKGHDHAGIGRYCAIGDNLRIITANHSIHQLPLQNRLREQLLGTVGDSDRQGVTIGHDVWIGDSAIILPGVEIGHGAVIGAGSVVTRSVNPYAIVAGNPARPIGERFEPDMVRLLLDLQWWHWSSDALRKRRELFSLDLSRLSVREFETKIQAVTGCDG